MDRITQIMRNHVLDSWLESGKLGTWDGTLAFGGYVSNGLIGDGRAESR